MLEQTRAATSNDNTNHDETSNGRVLTALIYAGRRENTFANINLTLISIIQGVALYALTYQTYTSLTASHGHAVLTLLPFCIASFVLICIATFEYTWFIVVFQWPPTVFDIAIPLGLGFFEILQMYSFSSINLWTISSALVCFAGALAYLYSHLTLLILKRVRIEQRRDDEAREVLSKYFTVNITICVLTGFFLSGVGFFVLPSDVLNLTHMRPETAGLFLPGIFVVLEVVILFRSSRLLAKLDSIFGLAKKEETEPDHSVTSIVATAPRIESEPAWGSEGKTVMGQDEQGDVRLDVDQNVNEPESKKDPALGSEGRTANLTLISILLGVILAALLAGLPHGATTFAISVVALNVGETARVVAVAVLAILLWLEYTWNILSQLVAATPRHNLTYFALALVASGTGLAVSDFRAWFAWLCALACAGIVSGMVNRTTPPTAWGHLGKRLIVLDTLELILYIVVALAAGGVTWLAYTGIPWTIPAEAQIWLSVSVAVIAVLNLAMQSFFYIPTLRRAWRAQSKTSEKQQSVPTAEEAQASH